MIGTKNIEGSTLQLLHDHLRVKYTLGRERERGISKVESDIVIEIRAL